MTSSSGLPLLHPIDPVGERRHDFGQLAHELSQSDDPRGVGLGKAVWGGGGGRKHQRHVSQCGGTSAGTPLDSVNSGCGQGRSMALVSSEVDEFIKTALARRLADAGLKQEVLAKLMGISPQQLSAQLQPGGHLSVTRLLLAADDEDGLRFLQLFWNDIAEHLGLENTDAIAQELKRFQGRLAWVVDKIQVRMAKADLRDVVKKQTA